MRRAFVLLLCLAIFGFPQLPASAEEASPSAKPDASIQEHLQRIVVKVRVDAKRLQQLHVEAARTMDELPEGVTAPVSKIAAWSEVICDFSADDLLHTKSHRYRIEYRPGLLGSADGKSWKAVNRTAVFDGTNTTEVEDNYPQRTSKDVHDIGQLTGESFLMGRAAELLFIARLVLKSDGKTSDSRYEATAAWEERDGKRLLRLESLSRNSMMDEQQHLCDNRKTYWLDPACNYAIRRFEMANPKPGDAQTLPVIVNAVDELREILPGLWYPAVTRCAYRFEEDKPERVSHYTLRVTDMQTSVDLPDSLFTLESM